MDRHRFDFSINIVDVLLYRARDVRGARECKCVYIYKKKKKRKKKRKTKKEE